MTIQEILQTIHNLKVKYNLDLLFLDFTDVTVLCRLGLSCDIFIQVYTNVKKDKTNLALVVKGYRIYGIDKERECIHEHPITNPESHNPKETELSIEDFILKSIDILNSFGFL